VKKRISNWKYYRTRFLVKAKQLAGPMSFVDALGREHHGEMGDYLVEWSEGMFSIQPRAAFLDIYVAMDPAQPQRRETDRLQPTRSLVESGKDRSSQRRFPASNEPIVENRPLSQASQTLIA
jgi:hypothetical protein